MKKLYLCIFDYNGVETVIAASYSKKKMKKFVKYTKIDLVKNIEFKEYDLDEHVPHYYPEKILVDTAVCPLPDFDIPGIDMLIESNISLYVDISFKLTDLLKHIKTNPINNVDINNTIKYIDDLKNSVDRISESTYSVLYETELHELLNIRLFVMEFYGNEILYLMNRSPDRFSF